jgi:hypothetical protein
MLLLTNGACTHAAHQLLHSGRQRDAECQDRQ